VKLRKNHFTKRILLSTHGLSGMRWSLILFGERFMDIWVNKESLLSGQGVWFEIEHEIRYKYENAKGRSR
jgi:hypothetical protein